MLAWNYHDGHNSFNRTIIELKPMLDELKEGSVFPFNRTIIELKQLFLTTDYTVTHTFNRTIIELKLYL